MNITQTNNSINSQLNSLLIRIGIILLTIFSFDIIDISAQSCSGTTNLTTTIGSFDDGSGTSNYANNSDCSWLIQPNGATSITLTFSAFDIESNYDFVTVYDGTTTSSNVLGTFSGSNIPSAITSGGGDMLVHFTSDVSITSAGWEASYTSSVTSTYCSGTTNLTSSTGTFDDGSGTSYYANNSDCSWLIQPTGAASISLSFSAFDTESNYDIVTIYDGTTTSSNVLGTFSGNSIPSAVTSTGGDMLVYFTSDMSVNAPGWAASYTSSTTSTYCSGTTNLTAAAGSFDDGSGTSNYNNNSDCSWLIQPTGAASISLSFSAFDTESNYDIVTIYDGTTTSSNVLSTFSGSSIPSAVTSTGGDMLVHFTSDVSGNATGWAASYTSSTTSTYCTGTTNLTAAAGSFDDGSGTSNYNNNSDCSWLIQPTGATSITLSFSAFYTEYNYDLVTVYDGTTTSSNVLGTFSGSSIPSAVTSTGGDMLVHFTSDASVTATGWEASYTSSTTSTYCTGTTNLTSSTGSFDDGSGTSNYNNNSDCKWLIQPTGVASITLNFTAFDLIGADEVVVYDGTTTSSSLLGTFTGSTIPSSITSTGVNMLVHFNTNQSSTAAGWDANYTSSTTSTYCSGTTNLTSSTGSFDDGSGTSNYNNNSDCSWLIQPTGAASISLSFSSFDTEYNYDLVTVYDGTTTSSNVLGTFSGSSIPSAVTSTSGDMLVHFTSDGSVTAQGWEASYTSSTTSTYCSGTTNLTSSTGSFDDGSGTSNYNNNSDCKWLIQPTGVASITLNFTAFDLIGADEVVVYDGTTTSSSLLGTFTGSTIPSSITSTGGSMLVNFNTNQSSTAAGWDANYTSSSSSLYCSGTTYLTTTSGAFDDGSGTNNYNHNSDCKWLIQPTGATSITLTFNTFDTELSYDIVTVYDGSTTSANVLGTYSGNTVPASITSNGGVVLVQFTTDGSIATDGWDASYNSVTSSSPCSGTTTLTSPSGSFDDGSGTNNYANNTDCKWLIQPIGVSTISLTFSAFDLIGADQVVVYDGPSTSSTVLGTYTGNSLPASISSTGGDMLVHFTTNSSSTDLGWDASYSSLSNSGFCSGTTTLTTQTGSFDDGSGSNVYANSSDCKWLIQPTGATSITLTFTAFYTEYLYDNVEVYDGASNSATLLGAFSGTSIPSTITSTGGTMFVHFTSDNSVAYSGWDANYSSNISSGGSYCSGTTNLTASSASFDDGSGTSNYGDYADCKWLIQPSGASSITLNFTSFDTEQGFDSVKVYDGNTTSSTLLGTYSGNTLPSTVTSTGGEMLVHFTSNSTTTANGWDANYTTTSATNYCGGTTTLTTPSGTFDDGSGSNNYSSNADCKWVIQPAGAGSITLSFNDFDTEQSNDFVTVYDGATTSDPVLGSFSGNSLPVSVTSTGGAMLVHFTSDGINESAGWSANYNSNTVTPYCSGTTMLYSANGVLSDGSDTLNYSNNSDCEWLIQPAQATSITFTMITLFTEFNADYVNVYDGATTSSPMIASFSGLSLLSSVTSSGGSMLVHFTTNGSVTSDGWAAVYTSTTGGGGGSGTSYCSGTTTMNTASGSFTDGSGTNDYGDNSDCKWLIQPNGATSITLDFTAFDTESGIDLVEVYDGSATTSSLLGSFSGTSLPPSVNSTGGAMLVHFTSDGNTSSAGWDANYTSNTNSGGSYCSGTTTLTAPTGSLSDGSGTNNYGNNADCKWLIKPTGVTSITLDFINLDIENLLDLVEVYDGSSIASPLLGSFSGNSLPATITSSGGAMLVHFTSNGSIDGLGWDASYSSATSGSGGTSYCSGITNLTSASGTFSDGSAVNDYGNNADCKWLIQPSGATTITLDFTAFDTETNDLVMVYDGANTSANLLNSFSGSTLPSSVTSTGGSMLVYFTSDGSVVETGWNANYTSSNNGGGTTGCSGTTTLTNNSGIFSDGSATNDYSSNSDCKWLIQPTGAVNITLTFSSFDTEQSYDFVEIYDGTTTSDPLLGSFSGNTQPSAITSTGGTMLVHFTSDNVINKSGWDAAYTSSNGSGTGTAPVADFTSTMVTVNLGQSVDFIDLTSNSPTGWMWVFSNGMPATSSTQNPMGITYSTAGCFPVTLTSANTSGQNTITKQCYVDVISGIGTNQTISASTEMQVFPNPNNGEFTITIPEMNGHSAKLSIYNVIGGTVYEEEIIGVTGKFSKPFDLSKFENGMYFINIDRNGETTGKRIIIQK